MVRYGAVIGAACVLAGCATELRPIAQTTYTGAGEQCANGQADLQLTICQANAKSEALADARMRWSNDPAVFDMPLLGLAAAAAGLLVFDGPMDAIKGVGLAAGTGAVARSYYSPADLRAALSDGSDGYGCLADKGQVVLQERQPFTTLANTRVTLSQAVTHLNSVKGAITDPTELARANKALENAATAQTLYDDQAMAAKFANATMRDKARAISNGLLKRIERKPIDFLAVYKQLSQNAADTVTYASDTKKATTVAPSGAPGQARAASDIQTVEQITADLIAKTPDIKTVIGKFDECVASSLSGNSGK